MQFVWMGFLKSGEPIDPSLQQQISDFLKQPYIPISSAGALRNKAGERAGYLVVFEASDLRAAEALVHESPIRNAGLYSEYHLFEYQNEVG
ncbi:MAG TPA: YciI family protein [Sphingomicrobium sp.]|nr:YciI family protein [Sphingomicrobium sp.]